MIVPLIVFVLKLIIITSKRYNVYVLCTDELAVKTKTYYLIAYKNDCKI